MDPRDVTTMKGLFTVEFLNGLIRIIDVKRVIVDTYAHPIHLECESGRLYNYRNIISIRKKDD